MVWGAVETISPSSESIVNNAASTPPTMEYVRLSPLASVALTSSTNAVVRIFSDTLAVSLEVISGVIFTPMKSPGPALLT